MFKSGLLLLLILLVILSCTGISNAQQHIIRRPPNYGRLKRDTVKPDYYAIDTLMHPIPFRRQFFHDKIRKELEKADLVDGFRDTFIYFHLDTSKSRLMTQVILVNIAHMQVMVENMPDNGRDSFTESQDKIRYLNAIWDLVKNYNGNPRPNPDFYNKLVDNMDSMMVAANENHFMDFAIKNTNIYTLDNGHYLFENHPDVRAFVYTELGKQDPVMMVKRLIEFHSDTFARAIITAAAYLRPDLIFNYATATNFRVRDAVHRDKDTLVQAIVLIADSAKNTIKAMPFLSDIYRNRLKLQEVDAISENANLYYENLVRLKMDNDSIGRGIYTHELAYRSMKLVREMNDLHESSDTVRFKCMDSLAAEDKYYLMVEGQDEIYTSSFLGTFKRMMRSLPPRNGIQLLDTLHYDKFRTFIKMCAGYNTLSEFLNTINDSGRDALMSKFISGLEQGRDTDLEDAVDVADAFGSINDSALTVFLQNKVSENLAACNARNDKKGIIIYGLLGTLLRNNSRTGSDTGAIGASGLLDLPPINKVLNKDLVNDSGIVYQEVFFFGDEDGKNSYDSYMGEFKNNPKWKIEDTTFWTRISSTEGKKIIIYANLPLLEPGDEIAQDSLTDYLHYYHIVPSIIIHRGHSYHLPQTIARLTTSTKIVILGSCGGYHNLSVVLDKSPDAHIVSSKQTGVGAVNEQILMAVNKRLLNGDDINWIDIWSELNTYFADKEELKDKFSDYVPPYKNLGALFIKAYRKKMLK